AALHAGETDTDAGAAVGRVYAANTLGAIGGSLLTGLVFVTLMGTHGAQRVLIIVSAVSAAAALFLRERSARKAQPGERELDLGAMLLFGVLLLGVAWAAASVRRVPAGLVAWGRLLASQGEPNALYVGEGMNASIAVTEESNGWRNFHVSGKVEASTES